MKKVFRSLRWTLTLWYIGILALILSVFGWVLHSKVSRNLAQDIDEILISQADGVAEAIFAFWEAQKGEGLNKQTIDQEIEQGGLSKLVSHWAKETGELENGKSIGILTREGMLVSSSQSFLRWNLPLTSLLVEEAKQGSTVYQTLVLKDHRVRCITRPIFEGDHLLYFVQVVNSLNEMDRSLSRLRIWLWSLIPSTLLLTSLMGWFLASLALKPMGKMISQVREIGIEDLSQRVEIPLSEDELKKLAETFNEMLNRIERGFQRLRQFSAAASHELRTPLTVMKGELEIALRKIRNPEEYNRVLQIQLKTLNELVRIVEELLTLARSEVGRGAVEWKSVELTQLVKKVLEYFKTIARDKEIHVEISFQKMIRIHGEERLLERLISNLLDNALRHTPQKGKIKVSCGNLKNEIFLAIEDTGSGIKPEDLPRVFDQFFSQHYMENPESKERPGGFGLGLCRWIAEVHQGRLEVSSIFGQGAKFIVFFPSSVEK